MKRTFGVISISLLLALSSCTSSYRRPTAGVSPSPSPPATNSSPTPSFTASPASVRISFIYGVGGYAYHGYYVRDINGTRGTRVPQKAFEPFYITGTPDGRFLARRPYVQDVGPDPTTELSVGSATSPSLFKVIVRAHNTLISDVLWSADSSTIFYTLYHYADRGRSTSKLYRVDRDGRNRRFIKTLDPDESYSLAAADTRAGLLYLNAHSSLEVLDLSTGAGRAVTGGEVIRRGGYAFSADASLVYYAKGSSILERTMSTGSERTLYRIRTGKHLLPTGVSPTGQAILLAQQVRVGPAPAYVLTLTGRLTPLRYGSKTGEADARWAPDGRHVWFSCECGPNALASVVMDVPTGKQTLISDAHQAAGDALQFVTWLAT